MQYTQRWCSINSLCLSRPENKISRWRENSYLTLVNWCIKIERSTKDAKEIFIAERNKREDWFTSQTGEIIHRSWWNKMLKSVCNTQDWIRSSLGFGTV